MVTQNTPGTESDPEDPRQTNGDVLGAALLKYKAVVFPPDQKGEADSATLDRLMEATKGVRPGASAKPAKILQFPWLPWLAAAACLLLLLGGAVVLRLLQGHGEPELVIINALPPESKLFAMRGGGPKDSMSAEQLVSLLQDLAVKQLGRPVRIVSDYGYATTNRDINIPVTGVAVTKQGHLLTLSAGTGEPGWVSLELYDLSTGKNVGKAMIRETTPQVETMRVAKQLLQRIK